MDMWAFIPSKPFVWPRSGSWHLLPTKHQRRRRIKTTSADSLCLALCHCLGSSGPAVSFIILPVMLYVWFCVKCYNVPCIKILNRVVRAQLAWTTVLPNILERSWTPFNKEEQHLQDTSASPNPNHHAIENSAHGNLGKVAKSRP